MRTVAIVATFTFAATGLLADTAEERLRDSTAVFSEIMQTPDKGIPQDLLGKAQCVVLVPGRR